MTIVAVTKTFGPEAVRAAMAAGLTHVGENYAQELVAKAAQLEQQPTWHYLGAVQRRKVKDLAPLVASYDGVARAVELDEIAKRAPGAKVLIEVDWSGEEGRGGCDPEAVLGLVAHGRDLGLEVAGLMTVAPVGEGRAEAAFTSTAALADDLQLPERSMGMSDDLEVAVKAGSTMVRVGRALFGAR